VNGVWELEKLSISIPSPDHSGLGYGTTRKRLGYGTSREFNREEIVRNPDRSGLSDGTNQFLNSIAQPFTYGFQYSLAQPFTYGFQYSLAQPFTNRNQASLAQPFTAGLNRANPIMDGVYAIPESSDESVRIIPRSAGWRTSSTWGYSDEPLFHFREWLFRSRNELFSSGKQSFCSGKQLFSSGKELFRSRMESFSSGKQSFHSGKELFTCGNQSYCSGMQLCSSFKQSFNSIDQSQNSITQPFTTRLNRANPIMDGVYAMIESSDKSVRMTPRSGKWRTQSSPQIHLWDEDSFKQPFTTLAQPFTTGTENQSTMEQSK